MAEESRLARRALAVVVGHSVMTGAAVEAGLRGAVVHVALAVLAVIAVHADAGVATIDVSACGPIPAGRVDGALVHILGTVPPGVLGRAFARVVVDAVDAAAAVPALAVAAVVHVHLTPATGEAC